MSGRLRLDCPDDITGIRSEIEEILQNLIDYQKTTYHNNGGKLLSPFFKYYPQKTLDSIFVSFRDGHFQEALRIVALPLKNEQETALLEVPVDTLIEWCDISPEDRYVFAAYTCPLFGDKTNNQKSGENLSWSDWAWQILVKSKNKKEVFSVLVTRLRFTIFWRTQSSEMKKIFPLFRSLTEIGDEEIRILVEKENDILTKHIISEETREDAEERRQSGSFE